MDHDRRETLLRDALRELNRIKQEIGDAYDRLADLVLTLNALARGGPWPVMEPWPDGNGSATPLVKLVKLDRNLDGTRVLQLGEGEPFEIPASLADLVVLLAGPDGRHVKSNDPFVGWKSWDHLAARLGLANRHAVSQRIHRLRKLLGQHGADAGLIQTSDALGARLGLARKGVLVLPDESP